MKPLAWALTIMVALAALIAVCADLARVLDRDAWGGGGEPVDLQHPCVVAAADRGGGRQLRGVECPDRVVIMRGRGAKPFECVCIDGVLATCFEPGP